MEPSTGLATNCAVGPYERIMETHQHAGRDTMLVRMLKPDEDQMSVHGKDAVILIALVIVEVILMNLAIHSHTEAVVRTASIAAIVIGIVMVLMFGIGEHGTPRG